jgi:hypothetical protein
MLLQIYSLADSYEETKLNFMVGTRKSYKHEDMEIKRQGDYVIFIVMPNHLPCLLVAAPKRIRFLIVPL